MGYAGNTEPTFIIPSMISTISEKKVKSKDELPDLVSQCFVLTNSK
jgi:hypothetical protein